MLVYEQAWKFSMHMAFINIGFSSQNIFLLSLEDYLKRALK